MRKILAAFGALALGASLAACSGTAKSDDKAASGDDSARQVQVVTWWSAGSEKLGFEALTKVFGEKYPDIKLVNAAASGGGGTNAKQKLAADLAAKNPPDTYQAHAGAELSSDIAAGYLQDVSALYDEFNLRKAFPKDLVDRITVDGKIYSVPSNIHRANVVWVNGEVLKKAGLSTEAPATLAAWIADMEKLKAAGVQYPITVGMSWTQLQLLETVLLADLGVEGYNALSSNPEAWKGAEVTKALNDFAKIMSFTDPSLYSEDWEPAMKPVIDGKSAYNVMGDWAPPAWDGADKKWGTDYFTWPVPGTNGVFDFLADSFTLPTGSKHPDGTKAWLDTISSKEGQIAFNSVKGSIPARSDLTEAELKDFSDYQKSAMESFGKDAIVSSIAHGAALPLKQTEAMKEALGKFNSTNDVTTLQTELAGAAAMK